MTSVLSDRLNQEEALLKDIAAACEKALTDRSIPDSLPERVRQYARLVRSLLDGCAEEIRRLMRFGPAGKDAPAEDGAAPARYPVSASAPAFLGLVRRDFPCLTERHPELLRLLMDGQPFVDAASWLAALDRLADGGPPSLVPRKGGGGYGLSLMTYHGEELEFAPSESAADDGRSGLGSAQSAWTGLDLEADGGDLLEALVAIHDGVQAKAAAWEAYQAQAAERSAE